MNKKPPTYKTSPIDIVVTHLTEWLTVNNEKHFFDKEIPQAKFILFQ